MEIHSKRWNAKRKKVLREKDIKQLALLNLFLEQGKKKSPDSLWSQINCHTGWNKIYTIMLGQKNLEEKAWTFSSNSNLIGSGKDIWYNRYISYIEESLKI